jgi:hypothetical protein
VIDRIASIIGDFLAVGEFVDQSGQISVFQKFLELQRSKQNQAMP